MKCARLSTSSPEVSSCSFWWPAPSGTLLHRCWDFVFAAAPGCHHIVVDLATVHPDAITVAGGEVRGVGTGMFYSLVRIADGLGVQTVWGEATENSSPFLPKAAG